MPTPQESLQTILARKPDYAAPVVRADSPVSEPTPKPSPEPIYTEHLAPQSECQTWLDQGRLYALIDGLDLPDLPGRVANATRMWMLLCTTAFSVRITKRRHRVSCVWTLS